MAQVVQLPPRQPPGETRPPEPPGDGRDILASLLAGAGMLLIVGSIMVVPTFPMPWPFVITCLGAVGVGFGGLFGLFLDREHRRIAGVLFSLAAAVLAIAGPFVTSGVSFRRALLTVWVPAVLKASGGAVLLTRRPPRLRNIS